LLGLLTPPRKNEVGYVANLPVPASSSEHYQKQLEAIGVGYGELSVLTASRDETKSRFTFCALRPQPEIEATAVLFENGGEADRIVAGALGLDPEDQADLLRSLAWISGLKADSESTGNDEEEQIEEDVREVSFDIAKAASLAVGCVFGRWDLRQWLDREAKYTPQDPYEPLPVCPPASLKGADGLPVRSGEFDETGYPIRIEWTGIQVDEEHHYADVCARTLDCLSHVLGKDT
jgi:hypothetical protein